jgi:uroporphyrinogen III methyltransferase/synthase
LDQPEARTQSPALPFPGEGGRGDRAGSVALVGAGPGDPDLITVAGLAALRRADVVVYDRLIPTALLREAPPGAELIDAGKAPGARALGQEAINALLAERAAAGKTVVRLKGGDPFVFGRGGEEALALRARGIAVRVVPGVTSAIAAPACAGIPVTHRGLARSVLIATGHEAEDGPAARPDWEATARAADTLVFLMGVERLEAITGGLIAAGRPPDQPAALVRWGSTPEQEVLTATLGTIAARARAAGLRPPATLIVGEVVALRERIAWLEALPLFGVRVLVTRPRDRAGDLAARLRALGALPLEFPAIDCAPLDDTTELDAVIQALGTWDWVVFTSANGVAAAWDRLTALGGDARAFGPARVCAIGPATAAALAARGIRADLVPPAYTTAAVREALRAAGVAGKRALLLRADIAPPALAEGLAEAGAVVRSVAAYRTVAGAGGGEELARLLSRGVDAVTFTSASTVTHLLEALSGDRSRLNEALVVVIGPATAAAARAAGLRVDAEADPHTVEGLVAALVAARQGTMDRGREKRRAGERPLEVEP